MEHDQPCQPRDDEQYVWPWIGVLVNVPTEWKNKRRVGEIGRHLREQFSQFCACKVTRLWYKRGHTGSAIVEFANDWSGFKNALWYSYLHRHLDTRSQGKDTAFGESGQGFITVGCDDDFLGALADATQLTNDWDDLNAIEKLNDS